MKNNFLGFEEIETGGQEKISLLSKDKKDRDIYSDYQDSTLGVKEADNVSVSAFRQLTNPTKSKYDNVVGWVKLEKNG